MIDGPHGAGSHQGKQPRGESEQQPARLRGTRTEKRFTTSFGVLLPLPRYSYALPPSKRSLHPSHLQKPKSSVELHQPGCSLRQTSADPAPRSRQAEQILGWRPMEGAGGGVGGMQRPFGVQGEGLLRRGRAALGELGHRLTSVTSVGVLAGVPAE